jgi:hypothetical protein
MVHEYPSSRAELFNTDGRAFRRQYPLFAVFPMRLKCTPHSVLQIRKVVYLRNVLSPEEASLMGNS